MNLFSKVFNLKELLATQQLKFAILTLKFLWKEFRLFHLTWTLWKRNKVTKFPCKIPWHLVDWGWFTAPLLVEFAYFIPCSFSFSNCCYMPVIGKKYIVFYLIFLISMSLNNLEWLISMIYMHSFLFKHDQSHSKVIVFLWIEINK